MAHWRRRPHRGYLTNGPGREEDVLTCAHCQFQIFFKTEAERVRLGRCGRCDKAVCAGCEKRMLSTLKCEPWETWLERVEQREMFLRKVGV